MDVNGYSRKDTGALGERIAAAYLQKHGFTILDRNVARKTGELDIVAKKGGALHIVEVKTLICRTFPVKKANRYGPEENLHAYKIRKVARTAEWYVADKRWEGEWQIDGVLVWLRSSDALARVRYIPQIL